MINMSLFEKMKKSEINTPKKLFGTFLTLTMVSFVTMGTMFDSGMKEITVLYTDSYENTSESFTTMTRQDVAAEFLEEKGITIGDDKILGFQLTDTLENGNVLEIKQGRVVTLTADGLSKKILTDKANVTEVINENGIVINENDWADPGFEAPVTDGMNITLRRIDVREETITEAFSGPVEKRTDSSMYRDEKKVVNGTDGERTIVYKVMYDGDEEVYREVISNKVTKNATPTVITTGTKDRLIIERTGKKFEYSKKLTVKATAYDTSLGENGGYSKTAYGLTPGFGIVAVDPKVIPLGTKLYIESPDGGKSWSYGYCIAGDTGGAIKGNKVDLCFNTQSECVKFGRRDAVVYILK